MTELFTDTNDELSNKMGELQRLNDDLKVTVDHLKMIRSKLSKTRQVRRDGKVTKSTFIQLLYLFCLLKCVLNLSFH